MSKEVVELSEVQNAIIKFCSETSAFLDRVELDTEIYFDARIYGDDLYNLLKFLMDRYKSDLSDLYSKDYGPNEGLDLFNRLFGRWIDVKSRYKLLTVSKLSELVVERAGRL